MKLVTACLIVLLLIGCTVKPKTSYEDHDSVEYDGP